MNCLFVLSCLFVCGGNMETRKQIQILRTVERQLSRLDKNFIVTYFKVRQKVGNTCLINVERNSCVCGCKIATKLLDEIRRGVKLHQCENCGRYLYKN